MAGAAKRRRRREGHNNRAEKAAADTQEPAPDHPEQYDGPAPQAPTSPRGRQSTPMSPGAMAPRGNSQMASPRMTSPGPASPRRGMSPSSPTPRSEMQSLVGQLGDPALDRPAKATNMCRNLDLPGEAYKLDNVVGLIFF